MRIKLVYLLMFGMLCILNTPALAAVMTAGDTNSANTSFNSDVQLHWNPAGAPSAGNAYFNGGFLLRTPADANNWTFAGDSLTITSNNPTLAGDLNASLIFKGTLIGNTTITINNFTVNGGNLRNGDGETNVFTLAGNSLTVGPLGMGVHAQGPIYITEPVMGSGEIKIVDNGSNDNRRVLHFASNANTYNGNITLPTANRSRFALDAGADLNFTIGASGVNNRVSGAGIATFNGIFNFNLTGASTNIGDSWALVTATGKSFVDATFNVNGFTSLGGGLWDGSANGVTYEFSESTGNLTVIVPEPATIVMILTGVLGMGMFWLRKRN
jgi:hypothetical protein